MHGAGPAGPSSAGAGGVAGRWSTVSVHLQIWNCLAKMNNIINLRDAVLCVSCCAVSDAHGDLCPKCGELGGLLSLARVLNPSPELGQISYIFAGRDACDAL